MKIRKPQVFLIAILLVSQFSTPALAERPEQSAAPFDIVFLNAMVVDGSGAPRRLADVGIRDGHIAEVGSLQQAISIDRIDLAGLVLAPGFIDVHSHADRDARDPDLRLLKGLITQGVTTAVFGIDGEASLEDIVRSRKLFDSQGIGINYLYYVGHNGLRKSVMGNATRAPTTLELAEMQSKVREGMELGAIGLSTGLMYLPGSHAQTDEVIALAREAAAYGGRYDSHVRDPARNLLQSIEECLQISLAAGLAAHPAHLKAVGAANFGSSGAIISMIEAAVSSGQQVTADVYPYDGATVRTLDSLLILPTDWNLQESLRDLDRRQKIRQDSENPPADTFSWINAVGYTSMRIVVSATAEYEGQMLVDLAERNEVSPFDFVADLVVAEGSNAKVTLGAIQEAEVQALLRQPWVMISSDGRDGGFDSGSGHPRFRGTFPRVIGRYVNELQLLTLEEAVRKMTSSPATYLQLKDRGTIKVGAIADIAIFDPETITDRATWAEPSLYSEGIVHVLVGGQYAMRDGQMTGSANGKYLPYRGTTSTAQ